MIQWGNGRPTDRIWVKPVSLKLKEGYVNPSFFSKPYDMPYHLRTMYEKEIKQSLDAGHIAPCGIEPSNWSSKAFPVPKGDGSAKVDSLCVLAQNESLNPIPILEIAK